MKRTRIWIAAATAMVMPSPVREELRYFMLFIFLNPKWGCARRHFRRSLQTFKAFTRGKPLCRFPCAKKPSQKEGLAAAAYRLALIFSIISAYCASVSFVWPGFIANTPPHSKPSLYFGTRCTCRWQPVSPYAP